MVTSGTTTPRSLATSANRDLTQTTQVERAMDQRQRDMCGAASREILAQHAASSSIHVRLPDFIENNVPILSYAIMHKINKLVVLKIAKIMLGHLL